MATMYVPVGNKVQTFPPHNYATSVPVSYLNPSIGNYQLQGPNGMDTSDGQLAKVNFAKLPGLFFPQHSGAPAPLPSSKTRLCDYAGSRSRVFEFAADGKGHDKARDSLRSHSIRVHTVPGPSVRLELHSRVA